MSRQLLLVGAVIALPACGGGGPAAPAGVSEIQALLDRGTPNITINGVTVAAGSTTNVIVGTAVSYTFNFNNTSGQVLHAALVIVRDDGPESLLACSASGSGGQGGSFGVSHTISANHPVYARGRTVRVTVLGAFNPTVPGPGQCYLGDPFQGTVNRASVQAERVLATLAVQ